MAHSGLVGLRQGGFMVSSGSTEEGIGFRLFRAFGLKGLKVEDFEFKAN